MFYNNIQMFYNDRNVINFVLQSRTETGRKERTKLIVNHQFYLLLQSKEYIIQNKYVLGKHEDKNTFIFSCKKHGNI